MSQEGLERDYVSGVFGDHVGGEEVNFAWLVGDGLASDAAVGVKAVHTIDDLGGAFDLDAPEGGLRSASLRGRRLGRVRVRASRTTS